MKKINESSESSGKQLPQASRVLDNWSSDPTLTDREHIILGILTISRLDYRLLFSGASPTDPENIPENLACLLRPSCHIALRHSVSKCYVDIAGQVLRAAAGSMTPELCLAASMMCVLIASVFEIN